MEEEVNSLLKKRAADEILPESPGYSRIFLVPKKNGKMRLIIDLSTQNNFFSNTKLQNGNSEKSQTFDSPQRLDIFIRSDRCLFACPTTSFISQISLFCSEGQNHPIQSSTIWSVNEPIRVHSSRENNSISSSQKSYHSLSLPRRLVNKKPKPSIGTQTFNHSIDCKSGTDNRSREVRPDSISEIHFLGRLHLRPLQMSLLAQWRPPILPLHHHIKITHNTSKKSPITVQSSTYNTSIAKQIIVPRTAKSVNISTYNSSSNTKLSGAITRKISASKSPTSISSHMDIIKQSIRNRKFSKEVADHVSEARRASMRKVYEAKWKVFTSWANQRKIDPIKASPNVIADFLIYLFRDKNCQVSTIKGYRSMIRSKMNIGKHPIISELIKSFQMQRPITCPKMGSSFCSHILMQRSIQTYEQVISVSLIFKDIFPTYYGYSQTCQWNSCFCYWWGTFQI